MILACVRRDIRVIDESTDKDLGVTSRTDSSRTGYTVPAGGANDEVIAMSPISHSGLPADSYFVILASNVRRKEHVSVALRPLTAPYHSL